MEKLIWNQIIATFGIVSNWFFILHSTTISAIYYRCKSLAPYMKQWIIITFLVRKSVKPRETLRRLNAQFRDAWSSGAIFEVLRRSQQLFKYAKKIKSVQSCSNFQIKSLSSNFSGFSAAWANCKCRILGFWRYS